MAGPLLTPIQIRERLVESYLRGYQQSQIPVTREEVERQVVADLQLVNAENINKGPARPHKRDVDAQPRERPDAFADVLHETGATFNDPTATPYRPRVLHENPMVIGERWGHACARVMRILQGAGSSSDFQRAITNAEVPRLAKRYFEIFADYMYRSHRPPTKGIDRNPFRGLTDKDASRAFMRLVEDLCDQSVRWMGPWYIR